MHEWMHMMQGKCTVYIVMQNTWKTWYNIIKWHLISNNTKKSIEYVNSGQNLEEYWNV